MRTAVSVLCCGKDHCCRDDKAIQDLWKQFPGVPDQDFQDFLVSLVKLRRDYKTGREEPKRTVDDA